MPKVLLVEDDNNLREIFEMRLQAEGYQTATASNGEEGIATAMKEKPDLIIADVMMPKLSGFEMVENLKATPEMKNTKVIMMTALGQAEDQARGKSLGVVKYLVKSQATLEDFAQVVKGVLPPDTSGSQTAEPEQGSSKNNQEGDKSMQEDNTQNNPMGDAAAPADSGAATPPANPVAGDGGTDSGQMSTAQEQSTVNDQVNSFAGDTAAPAAPAAPAADGGAGSFAPTTPPADGGTDTGSADGAAGATPPADPAAPATPPAGDSPA